MTGPVRADMTGGRPTAQLEHCSASLAFSFKWGPPGKPEPNLFFPNKKKNSEKGPPQNKVGEIRAKNIGYT